MKCTIIPGDISQKMDSSIFRYKKIPYWVSYEGGTIIRLLNIPDQEIKYKIDFNDPDLDFSSCPLGYLNYVPYKSVGYLVRIPVRKVKQGVNSQNTKVIRLPGHPNLPFNVNSALSSKSFVDMVTGKYPSLETALSTLRKSDPESQIAVSRDIALTVDEQGIIKVYYKNNYVGWIQPNKFVVHIKNTDMGWVVSKCLSHVLGWELD